MEDKLRKKIVVLLYNASDERDNKSVGQTADELAELFQQEIAKAKQQYHNEITDNETKVWIHKSDLERRLAKARIDEHEGMLKQVEGSPVHLAVENYHRKRIAELKVEREKL